jgi:hypothetical protein
VCVGRPRVGALQPFDEVAEPGRDGRPDPECSVDVQPRTRVLAEVGDLGERVERAGVHLARLRAHDRRPARVAERGCERLHAHPPLLVRLDDGRRAESEQA